MDYNELKEVIKDMEDSKLEELEIEFSDGTKIKIKKHGEPKPPMMPTMGYMGQMPVMPQAMPVQNVPDLKKDNLSASTKEEENYKLIKSPMVGTFYSKPSPNANSYVEIGQKVKKGDVLCIVEAMKLMNEIESEFDGEIKEILVQDGEAVEYGKPLFKIKK